MAGYSARQSSFTTGDTITAAHSNNEFNQILAAFHVSTGHTHDGTTAGDGGPLSTLFSNTISMGTGADTDIAVTFNANSNDGVITWMEDEDYFQFSDDLLLSTTEKIQFRDTAIYINSSADGQLDLVADTEIQIAATTVDINGNVDISGSLTLGGTTITSTGAELNILDGVTSTAAELNILDGVTSTAAELNILDGVTSTAAELNILDGVTSTAAELNILDGVTSTAAELNLLDGSTAGTVVASKAVVVDSNKDLTGIRNLTIAGDLTISGDDLTMATNTSGNLLIADGTNYNPTAVGDLSEISTVANDDVLLAVDTSGGGLKKITRSTLIAGISAGTEISNVVEDTTPQLGGDLDVNGNGLVSTSNGNIALTPNGSGVVRIDGNVDIQTGEIVLKNGGSVSNIKFYCESSNAHYTQLQSAAHSAYSGNVTLTLPAATDTLVGKATTDTLTNKTLTTPVIAEIDSGSTITLDATTDIILDADGGDIFFKDAGTTFGSATNTSGNLILKSGTTTALTFSGANATAAGNLAVTGDLTVNGTTTTVNSTTVTIDDPIFTLGGDTAPGSDDNKDRGIEFRYHTGSAAKVGFFGYDDSAGAFTFIPDATNSSEVFSGTAGNVAFGNIAGTLTTAAQTNITSVGALDGGSISSNFGAIDVGSSAITTTGTVTGGTLAGTLSTAAQGNVTSLGTLTTLTVDNVIINGTTIGHTSDTDLMTLASGGLTVAGTVQGTTITATTAVVPDASGGADLGSTSLEWGDLYIADDKKIYLGSDQDVSIEYDEDGNDTTAVVAANGISFAPHGTSTGNGTELRFQELAANGANYVGFKSPDAIASNEVWVLPNADGSDGQVLKTDGSNALSWADAGGGGTVDMVADGAIAIRKPVVLTAAGKAKEVAETTTLASSPSDVFSTMDNSDTTGANVSTTFESNSSTFVMVYKDSSGSSYGTAVAGTWSDGTITWGTPVVFESSAIDDQPHICSGGNRIHVTYRASDGAGGIRSGSISGTTITFAAETVFAPNPSNATYGNPMGYHCVYDTSTNYVIVVYSGGSGTASHNGYVQPLFHDTSDGTYTLGAATTLFTNQVQTSPLTDLIFDPDTNRSVVIYADGTNSSQVTAQVIQSTGSSGSPTVTAGADSIIDAGDGGERVSACYDTENNKVFVAYKNTSDSNAVKGIIGTVTGGTTNTIAFTGNADIWDPSGNPSSFDIEYDGNSNKAYYFYRDEDSGDYLTYKILTLGASSFSVATGGVLSANDNRFNSGAASFGTGKGVLIGTYNVSNSSKLSYGTVRYTNTTTSNLDNRNYLGIAAAAISDGATGKIVIPGGISEGHSSLTVSSKIFTNGAGAIGLAGNARALQFLGTAVSATQIQLQEEESDFYAEADGAITAGAPIEIDTTSGKIKAIVGSEINTKKTNDHYTGDIEYHDLMYDPDTDRYVAFYSDLDDNGYGKGVVGQYSSGTNDISWGTPVAFTSTYINGARNIASGYDEGVDRALVVYNTDSDGSYKGWARVVTITGGTTNSVAFGTAATYHSSQVRQQTVVYDTGQARCLIVFFTEASPEKCGGIVAQITGGTTNTVAYGTEQFLNSSNQTDIASAHFNSKRNKTLAFYSDPGDSTKMKIQQGTITAGTNALSWSSEENADYGNTGVRSEIQSAYIPSLEASVVFHNRSSKLYGHLVRPNFSTNPWYGSTELINHNHRLYDISGIATSDTGSENVIIVTRSDSDTKLRYIPFAVTGTGTQITASTATQLESGRDNNSVAATNLIYDPDAGKYVITSKDSTDDNHGLTYIINLPVASTKANFDGFANFAASSGNAVGVALEAGIDDNQSGLTIGSTYYLDSNTALTTTSTSNTQVGRAISATAIQVVTTT